MMTIRYYLFPKRLHKKFNYIEKKKSGFKTKKEALAFAKKLRASKNKPAHIVLVHGPSPRKRSKHKRSR